MPVCTSWRRRIIIDMTVAEWLRTAEGRLSTAGTDAPRLEVQVLAAHVLLVDRPWLLAHGEEEFPELAGEALLARRERREPLAYILGYREFFGRRFHVDRRVLIPRQETETLVEVALAGPPARLVLDLGTGSGIIGITYKLECPSAQVTLSDISLDALEVAKQNAEDLGADVQIVRSDRFEDLLGEAFDLILTNPPYIGKEEPLMTEVRDHEPPVALFSEQEGMAFYERLADEAPAQLLDGGRLLMEVGYRQAEQVTKLFTTKGWQVQPAHRDLSGIERVVEASWRFACAS